MEIDTDIFVGVERRGGGCAEVQSRDDFVEEHEINVAQCTNIASATEYVQWVKSKFSVPMTDGIQWTHSVAMDNTETYRFNCLPTLPRSTPEPEYTNAIAKLYCNGIRLGVTVKERCVSHMARLVVSVLYTGADVLFEWCVQMQQQLQKDFKAPRCDFTALVVTRDDASHNKHATIHWPRLVSVVTLLTPEVCESRWPHVAGVTNVEVTHTQVLPAYNTSYCILLSDGSLCDRCPNSVFVNTGGQSQSDLEDLDQRLLPLVLSVNPMGATATPHVLQLCHTKLSEFREMTSHTHMQHSLFKRITTCERMLPFLAVPRRQEPKNQNEVGVRVHVYTDGHMAAYCAWVLWIKNFDVQSVKSMTVQEKCDYLYQWQSFRVNTYSDRNMAYVQLREMLRRDMSASFEAYVNSERMNRFQERHTEAPSGEVESNAWKLLEDIMSKIGNASHRHLASYIHMSIRDQVVCVSNRGGGSWYVYDSDTHRWVYDNNGPRVFLLVAAQLEGIVNRLRVAIESLKKQGAEAVQGKEGQKRGRVVLSYVMNFPDEGQVEILDILKALLVNLDANSGDVVFIHRVCSALATEVLDTTFIEKLDTQNNHIIPFANGVLDLKEQRLRKGVPTDYVLRGPNYNWSEFSDGHPDVLEMEAILTTIFPDRCVRQTALDILSSLLHRRNRFKHFYALTGNTNGGKSLLIHLVTTALQNMCAVLPLAAIMGKENDPSSHSDYIARTQGMALAIIHEPDSSTQLLQTGRVKHWTSDSDKITTREMYQPSKEMYISWKLIMPSNTPPNFCNLDGAILERTIYIPCESTFVPPEQAPTLESEQFRLRTFPRKEFTNERLMQLAKALMWIMYGNFVKREMYKPNYVLVIPRQMRLGTEVYMKDLVQFQSWLSAFVRPCANIRMTEDSVTTLSRHQTKVLQRVSVAVLDAIRNWEQKHNNGQSTPDWSSGSLATTDASITGSPAWVRCQIAYAARHVFRMHTDCMVWDRSFDANSDITHPDFSDELDGQLHENTIHPPGNTMSPTKSTRCFNNITFINQNEITNSYNRFQRRHRSHTTVEQDYNNEPKGKPGTTDPSQDEGSSATTEQQGHQQQQCNDMPRRGGGAGDVSTFRHASLDTGLIKSTIAQTVGQQNVYADLLVGCVLLTKNRKIFSNHHCPTALGFVRAQLWLAKRWYNRYRCPLLHTSLVMPHEWASAMDTSVISTSNDGIMSLRVDAATFLTLPHSVTNLPPPVVQDSEWIAPDATPKVQTENPSDSNMAESLMTLATFQSSSELKNLQDQNRLGTKDKTGWSLPSYNFSANRPPKEPDYTNDAADDPLVILRSKLALQTFFHKNHNSSALHYNA